jgi:hypothetical protein
VQSRFAIARCRTARLLGPRDAPAPGELLGSVADHAEMVDDIILALGAAASGVLVEMRASRRTVRAERNGPESVG